MFITATEVKTNLGKYLMLAETRKILGKLFTLFHLLDTTSLDCRKAISSEIGDYEDAINSNSFRNGLYSDEKC